MENKSNSCLATYLFAKRIYLLQGIREKGSSLKRITSIKRSIESSFFASL